jgi:hypothetical protein
MVYPRTRDDMFGQLQRYHKTKKIQTSSEGSSFAQTGHGGAGRGTGGRGGQSDKENWADKKCHFGKKLGHPIADCSKKKKDNNDKSVGTLKSK